MNENVVDVVADNRRQVARFIADLAALRRLSPHTVIAYRHDLEVLVNGLGAAAPLAAADASALRRVLAADKKSHPSSVARRLAAWRAFFDYMLAAGAVNSNPAKAIKAPKRPRRLPKALTPDEVGALLAATDGEGWLARRDSAIFELFYSSGLRLSELAALNVNDADLAGGYVHVRLGKGGRGRVAPVGGVACQALLVWLKERATMMADAASGEAALFVSSRRARLGGRAIQQRLAVICKKRGVAAASPHVLRHSCASHFLQSSGDLRATQELLGHRDIATTQIYTRLDFQYLAAAYDRAHPRARNKKSV